MPLLLGNETSEATAKSFLKEKSGACKFEAQHTGTIEEIRFTAKIEAAESEVDVGIYDDSAGVPGTLKAHKKSLKLKLEENTFSVTGFSVKVEKGKTYHLALVGVAGTVKVKYRKEAGHEDLEKSANASAELNEGKTWAKEPESLKLTVWALGTEEEEGGKVQKLTATLTPAGVLPLATTHQLAGSVSFTGALPRTIRHALAASLSFLGKIGFTGQFVQPLTAALSFAGTLPKRTVHQLNAVLSFPDGKLPEELPFSLGGAVTLLLKTKHQLAGSVSFAGTLGRSITRPLTASLSFAGSLPRRIRVGLQAALSFLGSLVPHKEGEETEDHHATLIIRNGRQATLRVREGRQATLTVRMARQATLKFRS